MPKRYMCTPRTGAPTIDEVADGVEALDVLSMNVGSLLAGSAPQHFPAGSSYVSFAAPVALMLSRHMHHPRALVCLGSPENLHLVGRTSPDCTLSSGNFVGLQSVTGWYSASDRVQRWIDGHAS